MKTISLGSGKSVIIDDADWDKISRYRWKLSRDRKRRDKCYAVTVIRKRGKRTWTTMHRMILNPPRSLEVDHRDGNGLNNKRRNLRVCNHSQNQGNSGLAKNNKSGFKGVSYSKTGQYWQTYIGGGKQGVRVLIGRFDDKITAALAYDIAAVEKWGRFARTNKMLGLL